MKIISKKGRESEPTQVEAFQQCYADPVYFINKYIKIDDPIRGPIPFKLHAYQEEYIRCLEESAGIVAVMPRMAGTTSVTLAFMLWDVIFHPQRVIIIGGVRQADAVHLFRLLNSMLASIPSWLCPATTGLQPQVGKLELSNGSRILVGQTSPSVFRGMWANRVYLDNFAGCQNQIQDDMVMLLIPYLSIGGAVTIASTPNGASNIFAELYHDAVNGNPPGLTPFKKTVADMLQFDDHWKQVMKGTIGAASWARDFECEFLN